MVSYIKASETAIVKHVLSIKAVTMWLKAACRNVYFTIIQTILNCYTSRLSISLGLEQKSNNKILKLSKMCITDELLMLSILSHATDTNLTYNNQSPIKSD